MNSKYIFSGIALLAFYSMPANALEIVDGGKKGSVITLDVMDIDRQDNQIFIDMVLDLTQANLKGNSEIVLTPKLVNGDNYADFGNYGVMGRNRWIYAERNGSDLFAIFKGFGKEKEVNNISLSMPWQPWMEEALFMVDVQNVGCANCKKSNDLYGLAVTDFVPRVYEAEFVYVTPIAEAVKTREVSGRAFIDFKVNQTVILPDYRMNALELAKITATIDSVKNDKDITVTSLGIKGTASPEGPYANNERLAKGRTEALAEYVRNLYRFPKGFVQMNYEPVDWAGLAEWLENNAIENGNEILAIVEGSLPPEQRNSQIQKTYPKQYKWLLDNVYPSLRHSDYNIEFTIREYTQVDEILEVMMTAPQKLSLAELFKAASSQPEGSELYTEAFEIAVRMYPDDPAANLNAGIAAMKRGDYTMAEKYLKKAGDGDEARYSRAVLTALTGDYTKALKEFKDLSRDSRSVVAPAASRAAESLENIIKSNGEHFHKIS